MLKEMFLQHLLPTLGIFALTAAGLSAQTTLFSEDFNTGTIPPSGWTEVNNGVSAGWEPGFSNTAAWHDDYHGANDNSLLSPAFDALGITEMYLHGKQHQTYASWREDNFIEVSLDGGLTFTLVYAETGGDNGSGMPMNTDLSAFVGATGMQLNFRYIGDYANEWGLDDVIVNDSPPPPPPPTWIHLPTVFAPVPGFRENFDSLSGTLPAHMAVNMLDSDSRMTTPDGWCNYGQLDTCLEPYDGAACLEMGLMPGTSNYLQVSNALVIGLNGWGVSDLSMTFHAKHYGEESHEDDGIFVSDDGLHWYSCLSDWSSHAGSSNYNFITCDLGGTPADTSGEFYLAIGQQDDYPFADLDGVSIDNITVNCPLYTVSNLRGGSTATMRLQGAEPNSIASFVYSRTPGPTPTLYGLADFGSVYTIYHQEFVPATGEITVQMPIPPLATGQTFWTQALELTPTTARFSNSYKVTIS